MINLRNSPFLWLALVLLLSFNLGIWIPLSLNPLFQLSACLLILLFIFISLLKYSPTLIYLPTIAISLFVFLAGYWRLSQFEHQLYPAPPLTSSVQMHGRLVADQVLKSKANSISIRCRVIALNPLHDSMLNPLQDRFIVLQIRNPVERKFLPGDSLQLQGYVGPILPPMNPKAFDARKYYNTIGVRHQVNAKGEDVVITGSGKYSILRITARWQRALSDEMRSHTRPEVSQVVNALVWGDRSDMDAGVRDAFADSGAMHVLSVSGMHVAMIYSLLFLLLGAPGDGIFLKRLGRFIAYAVAILLYVGLTGACPAVVRAGLMILLYLFGKSMGWNTQVWNLLGFAAFMMLWLNPYLFHNIGFQLSFLAMAGILLFAKPIIRSLNFKWKPAHWTWEIVALSLAAQVFIVPVLLGQFHQFPLTFIISSIVAIPAGYIIILGAILNMLLSIFDLTFLWPLLDYSGHYFILSMKWMAGLNPAMNYAMPALAGWSIFMAAILFTAAVIYRWPKGKIVAYAFGVLSILLLIFHRSRVWSENEIIVYHSFKGLLIDISQNGHGYTVRDSVITLPQEEFAARGYRCYKDWIRNTIIGPADHFASKDILLEKNKLEINGLKILLLHNEEPVENTFPFIVLTPFTKWNAIEQIACRDHTTFFILPASLNKKFKQKVTRYFDENQIRYHDISQSGYFKISL